jgi:hypothetical protein
MAKHAVRLDIADADGLAGGFGKLGTYVGPRIGSNSRTQEQKEWWCIRRYIFTLADARELAFPISVSKAERPDFRCKFGERQVGVEVTEATAQRDQRELTMIDKQNEMVLRGSLGGRFPNGAGGDGPERTWLADVLRAARMKARSVRNYPDPVPEYVLLLYSNSNAASLIFDWQRAFPNVGPANERLWKSLTRSVTSIAVICDQWLLVLKPRSVVSYPLVSGTP